MKRVNNIDPTTVKQKPEVEESILEAILPAFDFERQVLVRCRLKVDDTCPYVRIWESVYLRDMESDHRSRLLLAHNISVFPFWLKVPEGIDTFHFTLIFSALPKACRYFDLFEDIPESRGFYTARIERNQSDVYTVEILA